MDGRNARISALKLTRPSVTASNGVREALPWTKPPASPAEAKERLSLLITVAGAVTAFACIFLNGRHARRDVTGGETEVTITHLGMGGSVGGHMSQIATLFATAKRSGAKAVLPTRVRSLPVWRLLKLRDATQDGIFPVITRHIPCVQVERQHWEYSSCKEIHIPRDGRIHDIRGDRRCYLYFHDQRTYVRSLLEVRKELERDIMEIVGRSSYIAVHAGRGCTPAYYKRSVRFLRKKLPGIPVILCTKSMVEFMDLAREIEADVLCLPEHIPASFFDFIVMKNAAGLVISPSLFSWWAAYLGNSKYVIAPSQWRDPRSAKFLGDVDMQLPEWYQRDASTGRGPRHGTQ